MLGDLAIFQKRTMFTTSIARETTKNVENYKWKKSFWKFAQYDQGFLGWNLHISKNQQNKNKGNIHKQR